MKRRKHFYFNFKCVLLVSEYMHHTSQIEIKMSNITEGLTAFYLELRTIHLYMGLWIGKNVKHRLRWMEKLCADEDSVNESNIW